MKNIIILNVWIRGYDKYHHSKSELVDEAFGSLEAYYLYYTSYSNNWDMSCIVEWLRIPQPISVEEGENVPIKPEIENVSPKPEKENVPIMPNN